MRATGLSRICLGLACALCGIVGADDSYVYPQSVYAGDIVELVVEYDSRFPALYALDSTPLDADFEVLDIRSRVFRVTDNGEQVHRMQWRLQLLPRREGRLEVPPLRFGDASSLPQRVEVVPIPPGLASSEQVFVETRSEPADPWVGQAVRVTTRIFFNTPIGRERIDEPDADDITRFRHGQDYSFREIRDGQEFEVLERRMAVIGSSAGRLSLSPAQYRGRILHSNEASAASRLPGVRRINRRSPPLELQLREPPAGYSGRYWLPATSLELQQHWQQPPGGLAVGDSLDWTLVIVATGIAAQSLPENLLLSFSDPSRIRVYPDRVLRSDSFDGEQLSSRLEQKFVIVVTEAGSIELPEISLTWWDTENGQQRVSRLAATRFEVAAAAASDSADSPASDPAEAFDRPGLEDKARGYGFGLLVLVAIAWFSRRYHELLSKRIYRPLAAAWRYRRARRRLRRACLANDAPGSRLRLLEWARLRWPGRVFNGLYALRECTAGTELAEELQRLDAALFAPEAPAWQGRRLWRLVDRHPRSGRRRRRSRGRPALADLYPA